MKNIFYILLLLSSFCSKGKTAHSIDEQEERIEKKIIFKEYFRKCEDTYQNKKEKRPCLYPLNVKESLWWSQFMISGKNIVDYVHDISKKDVEQAIWFLLTGGKNGFTNTPPTDYERRKLEDSFQNVAGLFVELIEKFDMHLPSYKLSFYQRTVAKSSFHKSKTPPDYNHQEQVLRHRAYFEQKAFIEGISNLLENSHKNQFHSIFLKKRIENFAYIKYITSFYGDINSIYSHYFNNDFIWTMYPIVDSKDNHFYARRYDDESVLNFQYRLISQAKDIQFEIRDLIKLFMEKINQDEEKNIRTFGFKESKKIQKYLADRFFDVRLDISNICQELTFFMYNYRSYDSLYSFNENINQSLSIMAGDEIKREIPLEFFKSSAKNIFDKLKQEHEEICEKTKESYMKILYLYVFDYLNLFLEKTEQKFDDISDIMPVWIYNFYQKGSIYKFEEELKKEHKSSV